MKIKAVYPGSFDPPTLGHLNIIHRASALVDHLYVTVGVNSLKPISLFSVEERIALIKKITPGLKNIEVVAFEGLIVDFAKQNNINFIIKALRNSQDFENESLQAQMNRRMTGIETLFIVADGIYKDISSTLVREIGLHGRRLNEFVPQEIEPLVFQKFRSIND